MITNNILANRLNKTRNGLNPDKENPEEFNETLSSSGVLTEDENTLDLNKFNTTQLAGYMLGDTLIETGKFIIMSTIFGGAANILFNAGFTFGEFTIVGLALGIIASGIYTMFKRKT